MTSCFRPMIHRQKNSNMQIELGAIINLDDITHIDFLEKAIGHIPETISCRYNPGGLFQNQ